MPTASRFRVSLVDTQQSQGIAGHYEKHYENISGNFNGNTCPGSLFQQKRKPQGLD